MLYQLHSESKKTPFISHSTHFPNLDFLYCLRYISDGCFIRCLSVHRKTLSCPSCFFLQASWASAKTVLFIDKYSALLDHPIPNTNTDTIEFHRRPLNTIEDHWIPLNTFEYHQTPSDTIEHHRIPSNTIKYHRIPSKTCRRPSNTMEYGRIPS